jgi:hypothetical protein
MTTSIPDPDDPGPPGWEDTMPPGWADAPLSPDDRAFAECLIYAIARRMMERAGLESQQEGSDDHRT